MAKKKEEAKATEEPEEAAEGAGEGEEAVPKKKLSPKLIALFAGAPVLAIAVVVGLLFAFGVIGGKPHDEAAAEGEHGQEASAEHGKEKGKGKGKEGAPDEVVFLDIPEIIANLNVEGGRTAFLKLTVSLELDKSVKLETVQPLMPRVIDQFQVYLRELRLEDLSGSAGMFRLKEELLRRVNLAVRPVEVRDVLFKEMIVQ